MFLNVKQALFFFGAGTFWVVASGASGAQEGITVGRVASGVAGFISEQPPLHQMEPPCLVRTLDDALACAYARNPELEQQRVAVKKQAEKVCQARTGWLPSLNAAFGFTVFREDDRGRGYKINRRQHSAWTYRQYESDNSSGRDDHPGLSLSLTQNLYKGGETLNKQRQEYCGFLAQCWALRNVEREVFLKVVNSYFSVVKMEKFLDIHKKSEEYRKRCLDQEIARRAAGLKIQGDVEAARAKLTEATRAIASSLAGIAQARANLVALVGTPLDPRPFAFPREINMRIRELKDFIDVAKKVDPHLIAKRYEEKAAFYGVEVARAGLLPKIDFSSTLKRRIWRNRTLFGGGQDVLSAGKRMSVDCAVTVTVPILTGTNASGVDGSGTDYFSLTRSAYQVLKQKRLEIESVWREVIKKTTIAFNNMFDSEITYVSSKVSARANKIALESYFIRHDAGEFSYTDMDMAEEEWLGSEIRAINEESDWKEACYDMIGRMDLLTAEKYLRVRPYSPCDYYERCSQFFDIGENEVMTPLFDSVLPKEALSRDEKCAKIREGCLQRDAFFRQAQNQKKEEKKQAFEKKGGVGKTGEVKREK